MFMTRRISDFFQPCIIPSHSNEEELTLPQELDDDLKATSRSENQRLKSGKPTRQTVGHKFKSEKGRSGWQKMQKFIESKVMAALVLKNHHAKTFQGSGNQLGNIFKRFSVSIYVSVFLTIWDSIIGLLILQDIVGSTIEAAYPLIDAGTDWARGDYIRIFITDFIMVVDLVVEIIRPRKTATGVEVRVKVLVKNFFKKPYVIFFRLFLLAPFWLFDTMFVMIRALRIVLTERIKFPLRQLTKQIILLFRLKNIVWANVIGQSFAITIIFLLSCHFFAVNWIIVKSGSNPFETGNDSLLTSSSDSPTQNESIALHLIEDILDSEYNVYITFTTVGYSSFIEKTSEEYVFVIFLELAGIVIFSYTLNNVKYLLLQVTDIDPRELNERDSEMWISNIESKAEEETSEDSTRIDKIANSMKFVERIGIFNLESFQLYQQLSYKEKNWLLEVVFEKTRRKFHPFFKDFSSCFANQFILKFKPLLCSEGDTVLKRGSTSRSIYLIFYGKVEMRTSKGFAIQKLKEGNYFGDFGLIHPEKTTQYNFTVGKDKLQKSGALIYEVTLESSQQTEKSFPKEWEMLKKRAELRDVYFRTRISDFYDTVSFFLNPNIEKMLRSKSSFIYQEISKELSEITKALPHLTVSEKGSQDTIKKELHKQEFDLKEELENEKDQENEEIEEILNLSIDCNLETGSSKDIMKLPLNEVCSDLVASIQRSFQKFNRMVYILQQECLYASGLMVSATKGEEREELSQTMVDLKNFQLIF